jgi:hypothetical protein
MSAGLHPGQLLEHVVRPTLQYLGLPGGTAAERLVMGTGAKESDGFTYLHQLGTGPALGLFQMEPATFDDVWTRMPPRVRDKVAKLLAMQPYPIHLQLVGNLHFAAAMCRVHYFMKPFRLSGNPPATQLAHWWKLHYNTSEGAGREEEFVEHYQTSVAPLFWGC